MPMAEDSDTDRAWAVDFNRHEKAHDFGYEDAAEEHQQVPPPPKDDQGGDRAPTKPPDCPWGAKDPDGEHYSSEERGPEAGDPGELSGSPALDGKPRGRDGAV